MGQVIIPHFGVHLNRIIFDKIKLRLKQYDIEYVEPPYIRIEGTNLEQETFFIKDPYCNIIEFKSMNIEYPKYLGSENSYTEYGYRGTEEIEKLSKEITRLNFISNWI